MPMKLQHPFTLNVNYFLYLCKTDPYSVLIVCGCVCNVCISVSPPILLANLWGFIIGFDKDCHRLERAHTRKSPMLHCGLVSYAERTISKAYVYGRTHTHTRDTHPTQRRLSTHSQFTGKRQ